MSKVAGKILWSRQQHWQYYFAGAGLVLAFILVLMAIQVYGDLQMLLENREKGENEFIIVNKQVTALGNVSERFGTAFSQGELDEIDGQPFIKDWTPLQMSRFDVYSNLAEKLDIYADLFFESVPDHFLDTLPEKFEWREGDDHLPILLSKDFLDIYNFNVTDMYGMPRLSQETVTQIPFNVVISGNGKRKRFDSRVVGFSYRYSSIMVPQNFLEYANEQFGEGEQKNPTRLVFEVEDAGNPALVRFLESNNYEVNREQIRESFRNIAEIIYSALALAGLVIAILSLVLFVVSSELMISRARSKIDLLLTLGYTPAMITRDFFKRLGTLIIIVFFIGMGCYLLLNRLFHNWLISKDLEVAHNIQWMAVAGGVFLILLSAALNYWSVRRRVG